MSTYWKQSLIIGGFYWLISLFLELSGNSSLLLLDLGLSILLLIFLLPLNKLVPIKWVDMFMKKHPVIATLIASVGWVPYYMAFLSIIAIITGYFYYYTEVNKEVLENIVHYVSLGYVLRLYAVLLLFFVALISTLVYGKSIAGELDDHYKIITDKLHESSSETTKIRPQSEVVPTEDKAKKVVAVAKSTKEQPKVKKNTVASKKTPVKKAPAKPVASKTKAAPKKAASPKVTSKKVTSPKASANKVAAQKTATKKSASK